MYSPACWFLHKHPSERALKPHRPARQHPLFRFFTSSTISMLLFVWTSFDESSAEKASSTRCTELACAKSAPTTTAIATTAIAIAIAIAAPLAALTPRGHTLARSIALPAYFRSGHAIKAHPLSPFISCGGHSGGGERSCGQVNMAKAGDDALLLFLPPFKTAPRHPYRCASSFKEREKKGCKPLDLMRHELKGQVWKKRQPPPSLVMRRRWGHQKKKKKKKKKKNKH